ncbi:MAG: type II and III secretion system protein [Candidatus Hydrogenedentes bacterium]|nr:type II and III secretion system protein [Candidatus Hydrogenedentota bacterium]
MNNKKLKIKHYAIRIYIFPFTILLFNILILSPGISQNPPAPALQPTSQQVSVSVKIIEFQTHLGSETGLAGYFRQKADPRPYGRVSVGNPAITSADITFPTTGGPTITVFLDRMTSKWGDFEAILQALVNQNRAFILSKPRALVPVGAPTPTVIQTVQEIPYENTVVVGVATQQVTEFKPTGVNLSVQANKVIDDDGDPRTTEDIYIQLTLTAAITEEGQRLSVAIAGNTANTITVPEFISRSITTTVWVRHGQVLILGGLYRNTRTRTSSTVPWLIQGEELANGLIQRVTPFKVPNIPLSSGVGNRKKEEGRRELVFLLKAELWKPSYTVAGQYGVPTSEEKKPTKISPTEIITNVIGGITEVPKGIAEGITGVKIEKEENGIETVPQDGKDNK